MNRESILQKLEKASSIYERNAEYAAPEVLEKTRNPIQVIRSMIEVIPDDHIHITKELVDLAIVSNEIPIGTIIQNWWVPVAKYHIGPIFEPIDREWKKKAIDIWMNKTNCPNP